MRLRSGAVISTWRPVTSTRISLASSFPLPAFSYRSYRQGNPAGSWKLGAGSSKEHLSLVRRRNLQLLAVLRDRATRQHEPFLLKDADDLRVAERLARIFVLDDLPDPLLDRHRRDALAERTADPAVEEVLHLEHALRRVHVLVVHDAADGRFVHADVVGHVAQDERPQILDAVIEKLPLEIDDARRHLVDRLLPLVH